MDPTGGKYSIVDTVEAVDAGTIDFAHPQIDQVYAQVDFGATGLDLTGLTSLAANADEIQVGAAQDVALTVEQGSLIWITTGSYKVVDTAAAIEAEVSDSSAGVLDGASEVSATDMSPLLSIAEYKQIVDGDTTLGSPYRIGDDLQDLSVEDAIVYIGAENYLAPQSGGPDFSIRDDAPALYAAEVNGDDARLALFDATSVVAAGGAVDIPQAKTVAEIAGFSDASSSFDVTDLAADVIAEAGEAGGGIIAASFVSTVNAADATPDQAISLVGIGSVNSFAMDSASYTDLTVDQVRAVEDGKNETSVSYTVLDDAAVIEGAISDVDNADEVSSSEALTLTVAEFDALDDEDTDLMTAYDIVDDAATVAAALVAGEASVNGAASITTNGGAVSLTLEEADALLNGNGVAPAQTGSVAADVTVTGTISVSEASSVLGTTYDVVDDAATVAAAITAGNAEVNGAASITTNGGAVDLSFADADSLLNGNGVAPAQTGSVAADVTVTGTISVSDASSVLGTTYDVVDDAATVAAAITAGNAEVNGAASITTNGGAVDLSFADADSLLNGNGVAPAQTGSVAADVTVTGTISVSEASSVLGTTYDVVDDAATVAAAITAGNAEVNGAASITTNGGAVDLSFADADSLLNGNGVAPAQTGSVAADVTVTGTISVSEASSVLGTTYDVVDDAATVARRSRRVTLR